MEKTNLLFLGDSITAGVIAGPELDYRKMSYAKYIRNYFKSNGQLGTYHNFAVSGFMTSDILYQIENNITHNENIAFNILDEKVYRITKRRVGEHTIKFAHPDITIRDAIANADLLIMTAGANDLIRFFRKLSEHKPSIILKSLFKNEYADDSLQTALKNYMVIMNYIVSVNPNIEIILLANYFPSAEEHLHNRLIDKFSELEDALFDTVANQFPNNITLVKPRFTFSENADKYVTSLFDIHPSDLGHKAIADLALKAQTKIDYQNQLEVSNKYLVDTSNRSKEISEQN